MKKTDWNGLEFSLIDTGGYVKGSEDVFEKEIIKQVEFAVNEANVILFVVDVNTGITDMDLNLSRYLIKLKKKVILVVNKVDDTFKNYETLSFII